MVKKGSGLFTEMAKKPKKKDVLGELLAAAPHKVISNLIIELTVMFPDVRRECFDFLKSQVSVSKALAKRSEGEACPSQKIKRGKNADIYQRLYSD